MMAPRMSASLCSLCQTKKATGGIARWLQPILSADRLRLSSKRLAALFAMSVYSFSQSSELELQVKRQSKVLVSVVLAILPVLSPL
jgi:hypothetical protein